MQPKPSLKKSFLPSGNNWKTYALVLFAAGLIFIGLIITYLHFRIKTIHIQSNSSNHNLRGLENLKKSNLLLLSEETISSTLVENNPSIIIEDIVKEYPDRLAIKIKTLEPSVQLQLNQGYAQLSENARVFRKEKNLHKSLPLLNFYQKFDYLQISVGDTLNYEEIVMALFLLKRCQDLDLQVESIDISGMSMIVFNLNKSDQAEPERKIFFTAERDSARQADDLETLVTQFKIKAQEFQTIDLRFDKPVVRF